MRHTDSFLPLYTQHAKIPVRLIAPGFGHLPANVIGQYGLTHRKPYYFLLFMIDGTARHGVDLQQFVIKNHELLFILPHQIHRLPVGPHAARYFKMGFDDTCLSLLPRQYPFLINPFNNQKIRFSPAGAERLTAIFGMLQTLLADADTDVELVLAHLNSLFTEMNAAYFMADKHPAADKLSTYIRFKLLVEEQLTEHPTINDLAEKLALNTNSLYNIVKQYSGLSPKAFITERLMLEAKRRLYYAESASIKELAYDLGFNDPEYFSRLFKKVTGKTIAAFVQDLSGN